MTEETGGRICSRCGEPNGPGDDICRKCGDQLHSEEIAPQPENPEPVSESHITQNTGDTDVLVILGFIFAALGICCCVFSTASIILGAVANGKGNKLGKLVIVAGIVALVMSLTILIVFGSIIHDLFSLGAHYPRT